jgi:hypothetical protein
MAQKKKNTSGTKSGSWKKERASVNSNNKARPKSNKYRSSSGESKRPESSVSRYWRAGYTRKDGTRVKGHYVRNPNQS